MCESLKCKNSTKTRKLAENKIACPINPKHKAQIVWRSEDKKTLAILCPFPHLHLNPSQKDEAKRNTVFLVSIINEKEEVSE